MASIRNPREGGQPVQLVPSVVERLVDMPANTNAISGDIKDQVKNEGAIWHDEWVNGPGQDFAALQNNQSINKPEHIIKSVQKWYSSLLGRNGKYYFIKCISLSY